MNFELGAMDVALVTYSDLPDWAKDEGLLLDALSRRGVRAGLAVWDDPAVDWAGIGACMIRSTWDYHHRVEEFVAWAERVGTVTMLYNSAEAVRWNTRKTYLRDLAERGVPVVPTVWLERGARADLAGIVAAQGWHGAVVVKPVVSASAYATVLVDKETLGEGQAHLAAHLPERDMMAQPFIPSVETYGEHSLMFIGGRFTHSVRRPHMLGSNVDSDERARLVEAPRDAIGFAAHVLEAAGFETLYARVDVVRDDAGELRLMELELVEPSLFLQEAPEVVEVFADAIAARLPQPSPTRT